MKAFADLLEALVYMPSRNGKMRVLSAYLSETPDPDRGWALASLAGTLTLKYATPSVIRKLTEDRVDPVLFRLSYDFVGDLAETASLIWPDREAHCEHQDLSLNDVVTTLQQTSKQAAPEVLAGWMDQLPPAQRFALLKLTMGGLRIGVSARLAKQALAQLGAITVEEIEEIWHGLSPPYTDLFAWLEGPAPRPEVDQATLFRPMMLANPLDEEELKTIAPSDYAAEWKWDGIRVQLAASPKGVALYSRTGDDISGSFPDFVNNIDFHGVLDGELLVIKDGRVEPFNALQQRLGRKKPPISIQQSYPVGVRAYDILFDGEADLRTLPFDQRRARLEGFIALHSSQRIDLSTMIDFESWGDLRAMRTGLRDGGIEGMMLKRRDSSYLAGRPKGPWFKWKRDPLSADCVLMYAQRGHGKRSSYYSDFTFGCWRRSEDGEDELVPVGKAYSGYTDKELLLLDKWVRDHARERFGPVRAVEPGLVFEVAFDAVQPSSRHKSKIAMRFPRIKRIRWDKPYKEADHVSTLETLIEQGGKE